MIMIEKNDPHQEKAKADLSGDDLIIELTDEILIPSDEDSQDESDNRIRDDEDEISEYEITALGDEDDVESADDERLSLIDSFDIDSEDEADVLILDKADDGWKAESADDEDLFDFDKEIELEPEDNDEDDYDIFNIDDEQLETNEEHLSLLENLELEFDEEDDLIEPDADWKRESGNIALAREETPELESNGDLPDLIAEMEFAFEDEGDGDADNIIALDEQEAEEGDSILARALGKSATYEDKADRDEVTEESDIESIDDGEVVALDDVLEKDEDIFEPVPEEMPDSEHGEELFSFDSAIDLESEDDLMPLDEIDAISAEEEEDVIEIAEFDQQFPEEDEKVLEHAGVLDAPHSEEEENLEFLEIEEIDPEENEESVVSDGYEDEIADVEPSGFLSDTIEEKPEPESDIADTVEGISVLAPETAAAAEALSAATDRSDFDLDSNEFSKQVDELDKFLRDDSAPEHEAASFSEEPPEEDKPAQEALQPEVDTGDSLAVSPEWITAAVESVINEKFSGRIEKIIYEVIEKVVSREIERLKGVLLENSGSDDN
jgi:hypothetical protein